MNTQSTSRPACRAGLTLLAALAAASPACTSIGAGTGSMTPGDAPVTFGWTSRDGGNTGTMSATLADGTTFSGPFLQMTSTARTEMLEPMWFGWRRGWADWRYFGPYPEHAFTTVYSGKVIANLQGPDAKRLRCRFHLNEPSSGMRGGGQGECQSSTGTTVQAVFPKS